MFTRLPPEQVFDPFHRRLPTDLSDGMRQGDILGADLHAVLRVAAVGDAARLHEDLGAPVGWVLKRSDWPMAAAPMKLLPCCTCGQTSRQHPQVMHWLMRYMNSCRSGAMR